MTNRSYTNHNAPAQVISPIEWQPSNMPKMEYKKLEFRELISICSVVPPPTNNIPIITFKKANARYGIARERIFLDSNFLNGASLNKYPERKKNKGTFIL